jgi:HD-GYP domain-containing protein (c-di-GMP phosphodiesterase class II)
VTIQRVKDSPRSSSTRHPHFTFLQRFAVTSLVSFLLLGLALAFFLGRSVENTALDAAGQTAYDTLHGPLVSSLHPNDLRSPMTGARYAEFNRFIMRSIKSDRTLRVKIWSATGRVVIYSDDRGIVGKTFSVSRELSEALHGKLVSGVSSLNGAENQNDRDLGGSRLLEVYIPISFARGGPAAGVFEIYQTYAPVQNSIDSVRRMVYAMVAGGLVVLYLLLFGLVQRASSTIITQQLQLRQHTDKLEQSYRQTIASLAAAVESRDAPTEFHSQRVTEMAVALGRWLKLSEEDLRDLEKGALLHDVGKIGISDLILLKPGRLTYYERTQMMRHPEIGYRMLKDVSFLEHALPLVLHHHERWDGTGYPHGLRGEDIPCSARLFAVIDAYDAITSDRPYRLGAAHDVAIEELQREAGTHFDPEMVTAFIEMTMVRPTEILPYRAATAEGTRGCGGDSDGEHAYERATAAQ